MIGQTLAHYEIIALLGKGGMGEVYRARDNNLGRDVALKILPREIATDPGRVARFRREAGLIAKLNHPGIITIHAIEEAHGHLFFTMELVEGIGLDQLMHSTRLTTERCVRIGERIAEALASAHQQGLVHRDLKPANILVAGDDRPKILDFGLAKGEGAIGGQGEFDATEFVTGSKQILGTIPYMSPEQIESKPVDARSDLFSLGIILHEMLSGARPFRAESNAALLTAILRDPPPDLGPDVPAELALLIRECLEKSPQRRPSNAGEVARRLRSMREHSSTTSAPSIEARPQRRSRLPLWFVAAALVVAAGAWFIMRSAGGGGSIDALAVLPFEVRGSEEIAFVGDGLTERLINQLSRQGDFRVMARSTSFRVDASDPIQAGRELGVDAVVAGRITPRGSQLAVSVELIRVSDGTQMWGDRFEQPASDLFALESRLAQGISEWLQVTLTGSGDETVDGRPTTSDRAWRAYLRGLHLWYQRSPESLERSDVALREAVELDPEFALAHAALSMLKSVSWQYTDTDLDSQNRLARLHAERALALSPNLAEAHLALAIVRFELDWDWEATEAEFRRSIELDPNNMTARQWYGEFLGSRGRFDEAYQQFEAGVRIDPLSEVMRISYAWSLMSGGRIDDGYAHIDALLADNPDSWVGLAYRLTLVCEGPKDHPRSRFALDYMRDFARVDAWTNEQIARAEALYDEHGPGGLVLAQFEVVDAQAPGSPRSRWLEVLSRGALRDADGLVALARRNIDERQRSVVWYGADPCLRWAQRDPRYLALLEEIGLVKGLPEL